MTLNASGRMSLGTSSNNVTGGNVEVELGMTGSAQLAMNDPVTRRLVNNRTTNGTIRFSEFYGKFKPVLSITGPAYATAQSQFTFTITNGPFNGSYTIKDQNGRNFADSSNTIQTYYLNQWGDATQTITLGWLGGYYNITFNFSDGSSYVISNYLVRYYVGLSYTNIDTAINLYLQAAASTWGNTTIPVYIDVVVTSGAIVGGTSLTAITGAAFTDVPPTGKSWPTLSAYRLLIASNAWVVGCGGNGGASSAYGSQGFASSPTSGGTALWITDTTIVKTIVNNGTIGGGGGGGGAGVGAGWPYGRYSGTRAGGGGGGAGYVIGLGGALGGQNGSYTGGAGGIRYSYYSSTQHRDGGAGGNLGQPGVTGMGGTASYNKGSGYFDGQPGAAGGYAIVGYSTISSITGSGSIQGSTTN